MSEYHFGNMRREAPDYRGWLCGVFADGARHTPEVEIKYWEFDGGVTDHPTKVSEIAEVTMILSGVVCGQINDEPFVAQGGDYMVIPPRTVNNTVILTANGASGITVKAPSDPTAKKVV